MSLKSKIRKFRLGETVVGISESFQTLRLLTMILHGIQLKAVLCVKGRLIPRSSLVHQIGTIAYNDYEYSTMTAVLSKHTNKLNPTRAGARITRV